MKPNDRLPALSTTLRAVASLTLHLVGINQPTLGWCQQDWLQDCKHQKAGTVCQVVSPESGAVRIREVFIYLTIASIDE